MKILLLILCFPFLLTAQSTLPEIETLIEKKQFKTAQQQLTEYLKTDASNLKAVELYGDAFGHQKKWDNAITQYKKLVDAKPQNANYHYKYGGALGMKALSVNKLKALTIIDDVKKAFLTAAELDANHIETRWALVELYMQLPGIIGGSKSKSLKYANQLQALSAVDGHLAKGYIYEYDKEPELAEQHYKKAIEIGGSVNCYNKLTNLYEAQKQPEKAIKNIEQAQQKHQRNALHYQIGKVCADYNIQLDKGEQCLKTYIKNHSAKDGVPLSWAYYRMAQIYYHRKQKDQALQWINKALSKKQLKPFKKQKQKIESM